jgi:DNA-binding NtrC family response regulator
MIGSTARAPTVLIVEDETLLRMENADQLSRDGYNVLEAANADAAISILNERRDVRLVFTDIDMPGSMDGLRLAAYISRRWPPIRLLLTSGHVHVTVSDLPEGAEFCPKPCAPDQLNKLVSRLLAKG